VSFRSCKRVFGTDPREPAYPLTKFRKGCRACVWESCWCCVSGSYCGAV